MHQFSTPSNLYRGRLKTNGSGEPDDLIRLMAISNFGDLVGGGEYSFFDIVTCIRNRFYPVVAAPKNGTLVDRFQSSNIPTNVIPLSKVRPWLVTEVLKSIICLAKKAQKENAVLIYANGSMPAFYGGIVGRILNIPVVWHCRIAEKDNCLDQILSRLCDLIIVNSRATGKRFSRRTQGKISIIHNGIDLQWLKDKSISKANVYTPGRRVLLVVARVSKWKRHDLSISAFEKVARAFPDLHLVLVGARDPFEKDWWAYLQKKTVDSPYAERIHWIGHVEDVRPWYRAASILLLPSDNEAFGRVLVEAMAYGIPVIATRTGGVPEIVRDGKEGILVTIGKSDEMAIAIKRILEDKATRIEMASSGKKRAKKFSLESHIRKITCTFEKILEIESTILCNKASNGLISRKD